MSRKIVGLRPWLPWPLSASTWWTEPIPAERLAALRVAVAGVLLLDLLITQAPTFGDFYGAESLSGVAAVDGRVLMAAFGAWVLTAGCLLVGWRTRLSAALAWILSALFVNLAPIGANAGDEVRGILLFYLMLCPCGAAWSIDRWRLGKSAPAFIWPWPLRLLFLQLVLIYFANGVHKVLGAQWRAGDSLHYVLADVTLTRWPFVRLPMAATRPLTWLILAWEVGFPLWVSLRWTRPVALWLGVAFHLSLWVSLEIGWLAPYMLCFYVPLVGWERWRVRR